jgi:uncharacterized protein DUF6438
MPQALRYVWHRSRHGAVCALLLALAACHKKPAAPADSVSIDQPHPPDLAPGKTLLATLERTGCYGECPVYRLTVNTEGGVVYVGTRWVKVLGRRESRLSQAQLSDLESAFERANFMALRDYDHVETTDDDWAHVSFQHGGRLKRVRHYRGDNAAPAALSALEDELDRITDSGRFVGVPATSATAPALPIPALPTPGAVDPGKGAVPGKPSPSTKPSDTAGPPDDSLADPDNHP